MVCFAYEHVGARLCPESGHAIQRQTAKPNSPQTSQDTRATVAFTLVIREYVRHVARMQLVKRGARQLERRRDKLLVDECWAMDDGRWTMDDGRWTLDDGP